MVSSGTGVSDKFALLKAAARTAVDTSIPWTSRIMPVSTCHRIVRGILDNNEDDLLGDEEYLFAVELMNELADQAALNGGLK